MLVPDKDPEPFIDVVCENDRAAAPANELLPAIVAVCEKLNEVLEDRAAFALNKETLLKLSVIEDTKSALAEIVAADENDRDSEATMYIVAPVISSAIGRLLSGVNPNKTTSYLQC